MSKYTRLNAAQLQVILGKKKNEKGGDGEVVLKGDDGGGGSGDGVVVGDTNGGWGGGGWSGRGGRFGGGESEGVRRKNGVGSGGRKLGLPVVLHVECRDLADMDLTSRSDPFVVVYIARLSRGGEVGWMEVGRTETVWDCLDPVFVKCFETKNWVNGGGIKGEDLGGVTVKVEVWDNDDDGNVDLKRHDYIGAAKCRLDDILKGQNMNLELRLKNAKKKNPGFITLMAEPVRVPKPNMEVTFNFSLGRDISSGLKKAFIVISRALKGGKWTPVWRTEIISIHKSMLSRSEGNQREFRAVVLKLDQLTAGVDVKPLRIEFWRFKKSGSHERLGTAQTQYDQLKNLRLPFVFNMKSQNPSEVTPSKSQPLDQQPKKKASLRSYATGFGSRAAALGRSSSSDNDQVLVLQDRAVSKKNATASFTFRLLNF